MSKSSTAKAAKVTIKSGRTGKFISVPAPRFFDGQVVTTTEEHYSHHEVIILISPKWADYPNGGTGGWVYGNSYCDLKNGEIHVGGGYSYSWEENDFTELSDPEASIAAEIYYRTEEKKEIESRIKTLNAEIQSLEFAMNTIINKE